MYLKLDSLEVYNRNELTNLFPDTTFPNDELSDEVLEGFGFANLYDSEKPAVDNTFEIVIEDGVIQKEDGKWYKTYIIKSRVPEDELSLLLFINDERKKLKDEVAARRYEKEISGITLPSGQKIDTDRVSQTMLTSTFISMSSGLISTTSWKTQNGWIDLDLTSLQEIAQLVANHVNDCFNIEKQHIELLNACLTVESLQDYIDTKKDLFW